MQHTGQKVNGQWMFYLAQVFHPVVHLPVNAATCCTRSHVLETLVNDNTVKHAAHASSEPYSTLCRFEKMALMILHEKQQGKGSAVSGYIEQLPTEFDTLLHWSDQEMQLLMYPHLMQQV